MPHLRLVFAEARVARPKPTTSTRRQRLALLPTSRTLRPILVLPSANVLRKSRSSLLEMMTRIAVSPTANLRVKARARARRRLTSLPPGPAEVRTTRGASQAHKEDPYEAEGFEPTTFDIRAAKEGLGILPKSFQASLLKGTSVLRLLGCGNCMLRNRKCRRENGHARCDACVKSGMSRCSDSFSIPEYLQVINYLEPLTVFSDKSWNSAFNEVRDAHYSQILCDRQVTLANARLLRARANLRALMNGSEVAFKGKVIPGIDSVAEEEVEFYTKLFKTARKDSEREFYMPDGTRADDYYYEYDSQYEGSQGSAMDEEEGEETTLVATSLSKVPLEEELDLHGPFAIAPNRTNARSQLL
ncbi:hypothetical protein R3P38DRAFT_2802509 [Favolaschia claudopus]|uniref:Zn(2)-C6 fungal-type domain-containing protein n=1 Tax=Favolaschia claudopus TaxID=2862362 RepID=A0AAV9ZUT9_9AGAR